jgi:hypothetical protein
MLLGSCPFTKVDEPFPHSLLRLAMGVSAAGQAWSTFGITSGRSSAAMCVCRQNAANDGVMLGALDFRVRLR